MSILYRLLVVVYLLVSVHGVKAEDWMYTIRPGDNLWNLTERHLTSLKYVTRLQQLNGIQDPYRIPPGKVIRIPIEWVARRQGEAKVVGFHGEAQLRRSDSVEKFPVVEKMLVAAGDEITTGQDAQVTLEFEDQSRLRVQSESKVRLKRAEVLGQDGAAVTEAELESGRTENVVPRESEFDSRFQILTPSAVSAVRGTRFRVGAKGEDGTTYSEVLTGVVEVSAVLQSIRVRGGYGTVTRLNEPPAKPVELLPAPDLSETPNLFERVPLVIPLKRLAGAYSYRVQIALDQDFKEILTDFVTVNPPLRGRDLPDGDYWLQVRGQDKSGLEGKGAIIPIRVHARPESPFIMAPQPGVMVESDRPVFEWTIRPDVQRYLIEISRTNDFSESVTYESGVSTGRFTLSESLMPGIYWWRIASVSESIGTGPYSDPMSFRVPIPGPELESAQIEEDKVKFTWPGGEAGQSFQFQMARDPAFQKIISDTTVDQPSITLPHPGGGSYYLRIKPIEHDGAEGVFGPVQMFDVPYKYPYWLMILLPLLGLL
jgi:hypothetical protein